MRVSSQAPSRPAALVAGRGPPRRLLSVGRRAPSAARFEQGGDSDWPFGCLCAALDPEVVVGNGQTKGQVCHKVSSSGAAIIKLASESESNFGSESDRGPSGLSWPKFYASSRFQVIFAV